MTEDEAVTVLSTAAQSWSDELGEYIIPADEDRTDEDGIETTANRRKQQDDIEEAIKVLSKGRGGVEPVETVHWFPDDLVVRTVGMVPHYGEIVQSERVHGITRVWVLRPGIAKPELWPADECRLLHRVSKNKEGQ